MDLISIGKFISKLRKEQRLTSEEYIKTAYEKLVQTIKNSRFSLKEKPLTVQENNFNIC